MKRLVVCCDGTWNTADQEQNGSFCPTNVVKLAYRVAKRAADGTSQIVYYDQGVGTGNVIDRFSGGAFGDGLEDNIYDAYRFLIGNYEPGDEIYLFGFSRGAFTARSIGGMIRKCGILDRTSVDQYLKARDLYKNANVHPDDQQAVDFRGGASCCGSDTIKIKCVGVWDTVGALGIPLAGLRGLTRKEYVFHDTELSGTVEHGFHALAIDEHRGAFEPTLWMEKPKPNQQIVQTWFVGAHSDVGGGYADCSLADIALKWMLDNVAPLGLELDTRVTSAHPVMGKPTGPLHKSKTGIYRLTKGLDRPVTLGATQSLHPSVIERWHADPSYRPANLRGLIA